MAESDQSEPINRSRAKQVESLLAEARKRLIDTGARNRLVHTNRRSKRPSTLSIVAQDLDSFHRDRPKRTINALPLESPTNRDCRRNPF